MPVFEDNKGAAQLAQNPISNCKSKHIDVRHHSLRKEISVIRVGSTLQYADFLTKPVAQDAFEFHLNFALNLRRILL